MSKLVFVTDERHFKYGAMMFVPHDYDKELVLTKVQDVFLQPFIFEEMEVPFNPFPYYEPYFPKIDHDMQDSIAQ